MSDAPYERLMKLARDGDASVALELIEAARRHGDDEGEALGIARMLEAAGDLEALREALTALLPAVTAASALMKASALPSYGGKPADFRKGREHALSWDEERVLLRDDKGKLIILDRVAWYDRYLQKATGLFDLDSRLDEVFAVNPAGSPHHEPVMELTGGLPTFGGSYPSRSSYLVLSYDRDDVLVSPGFEPDRRYIYGRDDYESGYE